jgi:uncharacterized membrane protein
MAAHTTGLNNRNPPAKGGRSAPFALGFAIGGLFDGILLHQLLQWHHLLSAVRRPWLHDLRMQVLADGAFHAVMWFVLLIGLCLAWRDHVAGSVPSTRVSVACMAIGFGGWHVLDAMLDHWVLHIHHIRDGSPHALAWDIGWLFVFGLLPGAIGICLARHRDDGSGSDAGSGGTDPRYPGSHAIKTSAPTASLYVSFAGPAAALVMIVASTAASAGDTGRNALIVALPGWRADAVFDQIAALDAQIVWVDRSKAVWSVRLPGGRGGATPPGLFLPLWRSGAVVLQGNALGSGCGP